MNSKDIYKNIVSINIIEKSKLISYIKDNGYGPSGCIKHSFGNEELCIKEHGHEIKSSIDYHTLGLRVSFKYRVMFLLSDYKEIPMCPICLSNNISCRTVKKRIVFSETCSTKCANKLRTENGFKSSFNDKEIQSKLLKTKIKNGSYGIERTEKIKNTKLEKYGNKDYNNSDKAKITIQIKGREDHYNDIKHKRANTKLKLYDDRNYNNRPKAKETMMELYGDYSYSKTEHARYSSLLKYGTEFPMQNKDIFDKWVKSCYKNKEYIFKTGETVIIMGYEDLCLKQLEYLGYTYKDFNFNFEGIYYFDSGGSKRKYFPDFVIPNENRIIEVKSKYTFICNDDLNHRKWNSTKRLGYKLEIWVMDNTSLKFDIIRW